jgi:maltose phosphorylase
MLATRGGFDPVTGEYGYYGVMGPDEFQLMVNHNQYTNILAKKTFLFTIETLEKIRETDADKYKRLGVSDREIEKWQMMSDKMKIIFDPETLLFEQHDGYFSLPHIDIASIPPTEFPLYHHWSYDRIYRNDIIKQPDVLMFMVLYASEFSDEILKANFDYYESRCIHESSLSPSVHSIQAMQLGRKERAYKLFQFAARMDLDNYNRNADEGLHLPSIAGSWMNIVYGFGGLQSDGKKLALSPSLVDEWSRLCFHLSYQGSKFRVEVNKEFVTVTLQSGQEFSMNIYGQSYKICEEGIRIPYENRHLED